MPPFLQFGTSISISIEICTESDTTNTRCLSALCCAIRSQVMFCWVGVGGRVVVQIWGGAGLHIHTHTYTHTHTYIYTHETDGGGIRGCGVVHIPTHARQTYYTVISVSHLTINCTRYEYQVKQNFFMGIHH